MSITSIAKKSANSEQIRMVSNTGVEYAVETITPDIAKEWLAQNTDNRKFRTSVGEKYARDMRNGEWTENGDAIRFAGDGTLLDGQHRLWGCLHSGRSIVALVVRNLSNASQDTMDDLAKRTLGDTFNFHGISGANSAASIVRRILMWQNGYLSNVGTYQPSKAESLAAIREDHSIAVAVDAAGTMQRRRIVPPTIIGLTWWVFWSIDEDDCEEFWHALHTGESLSADSPIYIVREQIQRHMNREGRVAETALLAWIIKAWNHYRADKALSPSYKYTLKANERIPEPK